MSGTENGDKPRNGDRLTGWKEIAGFFGKDERTVKRWESQRGLPVHRVPGRTGSTVFASRGELEQWLRNVDSSAEIASSDAPGISATAPAPASKAKGRRHLILAGIACAVIAIGGLTVSELVRPASSPASSAPVLTVVGSAYKPKPKAEEAYLQGVYYWNKRTASDLERAVHLFNQAIAEDPNYAKAFVGLANCYNLLREYSDMPAEEAYPKAKAAAERAIALDDSLAEAHSSLAFGEFFWFWNSKGARSAFEKALALNPNSVQTLHWYGTSLMYMGEFDKALAAISAAQALEPESRSIRADKGLVLYYAGREEESLALLKQLAAAEPDYLSPVAYLSAVYFVEELYDDHFQMARQLARLIKDERRLALVEASADAFAAGGEDALFRTLIEGEQKLFEEGKQEAYWLARTYAFAGNTAQALKLLRTSIDRHEQSALILRIDPAFISLRKHSAFRLMVVEVGLPPIAG